MGAVSQLPAVPAKVAQTVSRFATYSSTLRSTQATGALRERGGAQGSGDSVAPPGAELSLALPGFAIRFQRVAEPQERIYRDLGEGPPSRRAVGASPDLDDVGTDPAADLLLVVSADRVLPSDAPSLDRRVPHAKRGPVHILRAILVSGAVWTPRHDPDVLYGATLQHPAEVDLAGDAARGHIQSTVPHDLQVPAPDKPPVDVHRLGDLGRAARGRENRQETQLLVGLHSKHRQPSSGNPLPR